jgi:hypothetical protein
MLGGVKWQVNAQPERVGKFSHQPDPQLLLGIRKGHEELFAGQD